MPESVDPWSAPPWECADFQERATRHPEDFCGHTAVAIMRCIQDGSIEIR